MKKVSTSLLLTLLAGMFYLLPISAMAEDEPGSLAEEWLVTVKNGYLGNFMEALKEHTAVRVAHDDPWNWQVYTTVVGTNLNQIAIRHCCVSWAEIDSYQQWDRSNPDVTKHWFEVVAPHVEKLEHYFEKIDLKNSHWNEGANSNRLYGVTEWAIKGGGSADFSAALEEMSQIAIDQGWANADRNWSWSSRIGGRDSRNIVIPYKNYAAMQPGEESFYAFLVKHMGSEEAAGELFKKLSGSSWGSEYTVWELRPDLSMGGDD
jgi:hypothetical protein